MGTGHAACTHTHEHAHSLAEIQAVKQIISDWRKGRIPQITIGGRTTLPVMFRVQHLVGVHLSQNLALHDPNKVQMACSPAAQVRERFMWALYSSSCIC